MPKALLSWLFKWNKTIADYSNERWTMFKLPSWILMKWALKTDDDKGGQKQCQLSEAQLLSTSLGSKWMLLVMCFADMTYLLCCAVMDLWFRWKWKRKKFVSLRLRLVYVTLPRWSRITSLWWPCVVLCILQHVLFAQCALSCAYYLHSPPPSTRVQSRTEDALWIPDESQLQQKHSCTIFNSKRSLYSRHSRHGDL